MNTSGSTGAHSLRQRIARLASASSLVKLALWLVGCMWVVPFLMPFKNMPIPSFHSEAAAVWFGLLAMCALVPFAGRLPVPRVAWLPIAFAALIVLQMMLGKLAYRQQGLLGALFLLWAFGLVLLGGLLRRELGLERVAITLAWFLFAGALCSSIVGLTQLLDSYAFLGRWITPASGERVWGNLAQANHLADYLALGLTSAGLLCAVGRLRLVYLVPTAGLMVYILAFTGTRASWLYLGALVGISLAMWLAERSAVNRRLLLFSFSALVALMLVPNIGLLLTPPDGSSVSLVLRRTLGQTGAQEERLIMWQLAWQIFQQAPLLGVGFRAIAERYFHLSSAQGVSPPLGFTDHAHNLVFQVLSEFGAVGAVILLVGALSWAVGVLRQPRTPTLWWLIGLIGVLALHSMVEYPLWYAFFLGIAAVLLGLAEPRAVQFASAQHATLRWALCGALLLGGLVFVQIFRDYVVLERFLAFRYRYLNATAEVNKRAKETLLEIHRTSLLAPWVELGLARSIELNRDRLADKLAVNAHAMRAFPIEDVTYRQAMLLALSGSRQSAIEQWDRAVAVFPQVRKEAVELMHTRVQQGQVELEFLLEHAEQASREGK